MSPLKLIENLSVLESLSANCEKVSCSEKINCNSVAQWHLGFL